MECDVYLKQSEDNNNNRYKFSLKIVYYIENVMLVFGHALT